jgi:hypothetical protein
MVAVRPGYVVETRINGLGGVKAVFESAPTRSRNEFDAYAQLLDEAARTAKAVAQIDPDGKLSLKAPLGNANAAIQSPPAGPPRWRSTRSYYFPGVKPVPLIAAASGWRAVQ